MDLEFITTTEAAEILQMTPAGVRRHARNNRFGAHKRGGIWWVSHRQVLEYKARTKGKARTDPTK